MIYLQQHTTAADGSEATEIAVVESVKAASEIFAPVSGTIVDSNKALPDAPATVNSDPLGAGWFFKIKLSDPGQLAKLMDESAYKTFVEGLH